MNKDDLATLAMIPPQDRGEYIACYGMQSERQKQWKWFCDLIDRHEAWLKDGGLFGKSKLDEALQPDMDRWQADFKEFVLLVGELEFIRRVRLHHDECHLLELIKEHTELVETAKYYIQAQENLPLRYGYQSAQYRQEVEEYPDLEIKAYDQKFSLTCLITFLLSDYEHPAMMEEMQRGFEMAMDSLWFVKQRKEMYRNWKESRIEFYDDDES